MKRFVFVWLPVLLGVTLLLASGCVVETPDVSDCSADGDCPSGFCRNGLCISGCKANDDCPANHTCDKGFCNAKSCKSIDDCSQGSACIAGQCTTCNKDEQCGPKAYCVNNVCRKGSCSGPDDASCPNGQACRDHTCGPCQNNKECGAQRICKAGTCVAGCSVASDCKNNQVCDTTSHTCKECLQTSDCTQGVCDTASHTCKECLQTSDCAQGVCDTASHTCKGCLKDSDCTQGVCDTSDHTCKACAKNKDCPSGQICQQNTCVPCAQDSDCDSGQRCRQGRCEKPECQQTSDCSDGKICQDGACVPCAQDSDCDTRRICEQGQCLPAQCQTDSDCSTGQICRIQRCGNCTQDSECGASKLCVNNACVAASCRTDSDCTGGKICKNKQCVGCAQDGDCPTGEVCDPSKKVCRKGCRSNADCQSPFQCLTPAKTCGCTQDSDCAQGKLCLKGACQTGNCRTSSDCNGQLCQNNTCTPCTANSQCGAGKLCVTSSGKCVTGNCQSNADCTNGKVCRNFTCSACQTDNECGQGQLCQTSSGKCFAGACRAHGDCSGSQYCKNFQCLACPQVSFNIQGNKEGTRNALVNQVVSFPAGTLPTPVTWAFASGQPSWLKIAKVSANAIQLTGTASTAGTFHIKLKVTAGGCGYTVSTSLKIWPRLESLVQGVLKGTSPLKLAAVNTTIKGGKPPYNCNIYQGNGQGTMPGGVAFDLNDTTGCTLTGTPDNTNVPGVYGFLITVSDSLNQRVDIPVSYKYKTCNDGQMKVTPSVDTIPIKQAGSAYSWQIEINNLDLYNDNGTCRYQFFMLLNLGPLNTNGSLSCASNDPVCVECNSNTQFCLSNATTCPATLTVSHALKVRKHTPIRTNALAFQTLEPRYTYSLNKFKNCHWEVLEKP